MTNRKAQWESGDIDTYVNEFMQKFLEPGQMPLSQRSLSDESPNKNMNKTSPFKENGESIKQTGDDQVQLQQTPNNMGGYISIMANRKIRMALFDSGFAAPTAESASGTINTDWADPHAGPSPADRDDPRYKRDWETLTDKERSQPLSFRDKNKKIDQILPGMVDPTRDGSDGERI